MIAGIVAGAFIYNIYLFGWRAAGEHAVADTAATEIAEYMKDVYGEETGVIFYDVFVKNKVNEYECIVICAVKGDMSVDRMSSFRIVINKDDDETDIFTEFNQSEYNRLAAGTDEERVKAGIMLNHKAEYERCIAEIHADDGRENAWFEADSAYINVMQNKQK